MSDTLETEVNTCEHRVLVNNIVQCKFERYCPYKKQIGRIYSSDFKILCEYTTSQDEIWK